MKKYKAQPTEKHLIAHNKHTGQRLNNRHTSFPVLFFMLLMIGVFLLSITAQSQALNGNGNVLVTARVAGQPPAEPAYITNPLSGASVNSYVIPVNGKCAHATIIELYRNNILAGTAFCGSNGTYSLSVGLVCGENDLMTKIYNLGQTEGPNSSIYKVNLYEPTKTITTVTTPVLGAANGEYTLSSNGQGCALTSAPMLLQSSLSYQSVTVGQPLRWTLNIGGGTGPYAINIDWGDGSSSILSVASEGNFQISHVYQQPGGYHGDYPIKVTATDALNDQSFIELFALVNSTTQDPVAVHNPSNNGGAAGTLGSDMSNGPSNGILHAAWSVYGLGALMAVSFWLGELKGFGAIGKHRINLKLKTHSH